MPRAIRIQVINVTFSGHTSIRLPPTDANSDANAARQKYQERTNCYHNDPFGGQAEEFLIDGRFTAERERGRREE